MSWAVRNSATSFSTSPTASPCLVAWRTLPMAVTTSGLLSRRGGLGTPPLSTLRGVFLDHDGSPSPAAAPRFGDPGHDVGTEADGTDEEAGRIVLHQGQQYAPFGGTHGDGDAQDQGQAGPGRQPGRGG